MSVLRRVWLWLAGLWRRHPKVDRSVFTHDHVGATNVWGLRHGVPVRVVGNRNHSGMYSCETPDGRRWSIPATHLRRVA